MKQHQRRQHGTDDAKKLQNIDNNDTQYYEVYKALNDGRDRQKATNEPHEYAKTNDNHK